MHRSRIECVFVLFMFVVSVATLLNVRYIRNLYRGHSGEATFSMRSVSSDDKNASCSGEYAMDSDMLREYTKVQQQSPYNTSTQHVYNKTVLILTPISNVGKNLADYFHLLCSLSYPRHLISVALGEDTSKDRSLEVAKLYAKNLGSSFRRVDVHHFEEDLKGKPLYSRHDWNWQEKRRSHMAQARNRLVSVALEDEEWVLWLDADIKYAPPDIIQHLLSCRSDVCAASCMFRAADGWRVYDMNSWQETNASRAFLREQAPDFLMLEGYRDTKRLMLPSIHDQGQVVDLDGVGGCALLVRADCHRKGLMFPTFVFEHHIETEGLAKLAKKMHFSVKGLPFVFVFHV